MSRCFGSPTDYIAKDFIEKKRNEALYCHLKKKYEKIDNKFKTNNILVDKNGKIKHYKSYNLIMNLSKGFQDNKLEGSTDLSSVYFDQEIPQNMCEETPSVSNTDISNNYEYRGTPLKTTLGQYPVAGLFDADGNFWMNNIAFIGNNKTNNVYAEIGISNPEATEVDSNNKFLDKRKKKYTICSNYEKGYTIDLTK